MRGSGHAERLPEMAPHPALPPIADSGGRVPGEPQSMPILTPMGRRGGGGAAEFGARIVEVVHVIGEVVEDLISAITRARGGDPWRTVTVVTPSVTASLQWRRRVARQAGGTFNVRWIDLAQLAQETVARSGELARPAPEAVQIAAAWQALQEGPESLGAFRASPEMPGQLLRAFRALEGVADDALAGVGDDVRGLYDLYLRALGPYTTPGQDLRRACALMSAFEGSDGDLILLQGASRNAIETAFCDELAWRAIRVPVSRGGLPEIDAREVHDESDEVEFAYALVQDAVLGPEAVAPHEIALVVPARDPYGKILEGVGLEWNGLVPRTLSETPAGAALAAVPWGDASWKQILGEWPRAVGDDSPTDAQALRDQIDSWLGVAELGLPPERSLVEALRTAALARARPRTSAFGDGVFVGPPGRFSGLAFRRTIVLGFTSHRFPSRVRAIPLLPPGLGVPDPEAQRQAFVDLLATCGQTTLVYARTDRRNGREAFPSPWLSDLAPAPATEFASSLALLGRVGPRTASAVRIARALGEGKAHPRAQALLNAWRSGDLAIEGRVSASLLPDRPLSASQLECFFECPRKWFLRYHVGLREPVERPAIGFLPMDLGNAVHGALRDLFQAHLAVLADPGRAWAAPDRAALRDALRQRLAQLLPRTFLPTEEAELRRWGARLDTLLAFDSRYRAEHGSVPDQLEARLAGTIAGVAIEGKADRIDREESGARTVIDYKTGREPTRKAKDPTDGGKLLQGLIYAHLARQTWTSAEAVRGVYWSVSAPAGKTEFVQELTQASTELLESRVGLARRMLVEGWVPMRPTREFPLGLCGRCAFRTICPGDREAIALSQDANATGAFSEFLSIGEEDSEDAE